MTTLLAALVGLLAGLHAATWGMYKDVPHEGFSRAKYARSPILGSILGVLVQGATGLHPGRAADLVVLFGAVYVVERALAEIYKTFLREEDQSKYFIPMQFHVFGRVVRSRITRLVVGALYAGLLIALVVGASRLDQNVAGRESLFSVLLVGGLGGWISAFGGAWKDAPAEGFQLFKFFRSPALAVLYAFGLSFLTDSIVVIALAAAGYTVATTETYKTFFFPSKPRGKFAGRPVLHPDLLRWRQRFIPLYVAIWLAVAVSLAVAVGASGEATLPLTFVLLTLWCHGPLSPLLPAAYEPVLMAYGQLFPPVPLAVVGAVTATAVEYLNYYLYRRVLDCKAIDRLLNGSSTRRVKALFSRQPFFTVWICVWSPLPDWGARVLAAHSGYPVTRYLSAVLLARLPRFWFLAALGLHLKPGPGVVVAIMIGSVAVALIGAVRRRARCDRLTTGVPRTTSLLEPAVRAIPLLLIGFLTALPAAAAGLQARQPTRGSFDQSAKGVSLDRFTYEGSGATAVTLRLTALRPGAVGTELGVSLFPDALAGGALLLAPDFGAAYNLRLASATLLMKAGGSAITGLGGSFAFYPGLHVGAGLILPVENRAGFRLDVIRHFYQIDNEIVRLWSLGFGLTVLPRIPTR